jgi:hypothetical protein
VAATCMARKPSTGLPSKARSCRSRWLGGPSGGGTVQKRRRLRWQRVSGLCRWSSPPRPEVAGFLWVRGQAVDDQ